MSCDGLCWLIFFYFLFFLKIVRYAAGSFDVRTINALLHAIGMSSVCISSTLVCIPLENKVNS